MRFVACALATLVVGACAAPVEESDLRERIEAAGVFAPHRNVIGDEAEVQLGQLLFFDPELSGNRNIACATCHLPEFHAVDGQELGRGEGGTGIGPSRRGGTTLPRSVIPPFNRSFVTSFLWDGRVELLPDGSLRAPVALPADIDDPMVAQALMPLLDRDEMRGQVGTNELADLPDDEPFAIWQAIMDRLLRHDGYVSRFASVYPGEEPSISHVARALAAFERQIWDVSDTSFDAFLDVNPFADRGTFGALELEGADLFFGDAGCARCHDGPLLSDMGFHNIGVPQIGPGKDPETGLDEGRFLVTGDPADRFAFRTPPLRNVDLTGPYMHDGAYVTLEQVIIHHLDAETNLRNYAPPSWHAGEVHGDAATHERILATLDPGLAPPRELDASEIQALVAFLRSLNSFTEEFIFPDAGVPRALPSGLTPPSNR